MLSLRSVHFGIWLWPLQRKTDESTWSNRAGQLKRCKSLEWSGSPVGIAVRREFRVVSGPTVDVTSPFTMGRWFRSVRSVNSERLQTTPRHPTLSRNSLPSQ